MTVRRKQPATDVASYISHGYMEVDGWLAVLDAKIIAAIGNAQTEAAVQGDVAEIGVYQGRLLVLLGMLRHVGEKAIAIDPLFGDTFRGVEVEKNERRIERLQKKILKNVEKFCGGIDDFQHVLKGSDDISFDDLQDISQQVRLASIDGNHQAEFVHHDLALMESVLVDAGVILMDDVFNICYPGVSNGVHSFLSQTNRLVPFYIGPNKVYLCRPEFADKYRETITSHSAIPNWGESVYFGHRVNVFDIAVAGNEGKVSRPPQFIKK